MVISLPDYKKLGAIITNRGTITSSFIKLVLLIAETARINELF